MNKLIILALYYNVDGYSHQHTDHIMDHIKNEMYNIFSNIENYNVKTLILPVRDSQPTRIECIYPNNPKNVDGLMVQFYEEIVKQQYDQLSVTNLNNIMRKVKINRLLKKGS